MQTEPCFRRIEPATAEYLNPTNQGELIKKARLTASITLANMAERLGIHRTTLTDYEFNRTFIPNGIIARVEETCQLPRYSLFDEYHLFIENCDDIIREYCKKEKLSLSAFARKIGISRYAVFAWLSKKKKPAYENWLLVKQLISNEP